MRAQAQAAQNGQEQPVKSSSPNDEVEITVQQTKELVARLTAVRGALRDHLEENPTVYSGVTAMLDFVGQICRKLKGTVLGEGSGPLQELLVMEVGKRLHEVDIGKHFTATSFEAKIKQMNGYQSHIVSPEKAIYALIADAFKDCTPIAQWMVVSVRTFLSKAAKDCASDVVERDPDHRQQLADLIVQGMDEVLNDWELVAQQLASDIMAMEGTIVSPVFFQRLALKRKQRELRGTDNSVATGVRGAASRMAAGGASLLARLRGKKPDANESTGRRVTRSTRDSEPDDGPTPSARPSFAGRRAPSSSASITQQPFQPGPARSLRFLKHVPNWEALAPLGLKDKDSQFQIVKGKFQKRAHATGFQKAVTKSWSDRYFVYDCSNCDLFYWKEMPSQEYVEKYGQDEHCNGTRVIMARARLSEPSKDEMKGSSSSDFGVRVENAFIKNKVDTLVLGFASDRERNTFVRYVAASLKEKQEEPQEEAEPEEAEETADADPGDADAEAEEYGGYRPEDEEQAADDGADDDYDDSDGLPDSPTGTYRPGGLGVGSHFFNADDLRDASGNKLVTGEINVPARFRTRSRDVSADSEPASHRVEGTEAMTWLTSDMGVYVTIVKDTVAATLPKMAVSVLLEPIVSNTLLRLMQKKALMWQDSVADEASSAPPRTLHGTDATNTALQDLEKAMTEVRMASTWASMEQAREKEKKDVRCKVTVLALALAADTRLLAAAQQPSPETLLEDLYGPLFPFKALEASDTAAKRWLAQEEYDRTRVTINVDGDPLAPPPGSRNPAARDEEDSDTQGLRGGNRSGIANGVTSSVVDFASRMRDGMTGRRRVTDQEVEDEQRSLPVQAQPLSAPARRPAASRPSPAPAAAGTEDALGTPAVPSQPPAANNDPLGGGGLGPALGFGSDPLAAARPARPPPQENGRSRANGEYDDDDEDADDVPLQRAAQQASGAPLRAPRPVPQRAPPGPRRAPPPPAQGGALRAAPPPPNIGRPGPMRAAPGRPAPVAASRPAPVRRPSGQDNLPL